MTNEIIASSQERKVFSQNKFIPIRGHSLTPNDVIHVLRSLEDVVKANGREELSTAFSKPSDLSEEDWKRGKTETLSDAYRVTISIRYREGKTLFVPSAHQLTTQEFDSKVVQVFATNKTAYQAFFKNRIQLDHFELRFDCDEAPLLDSRNPVSEPTPNGSHLGIVGLGDRWLPGIETAVFERLRENSNRRGLLHKAFSYDAGLFLLAIPLFFFTATRLGHVDKWRSHSRIEVMSTKPRKLSAVLS